MGIYNVRKIENWLEDFTSEKNKFTNTYYDDYKNSYIRTCSDSTIKKMCSKLNQHYYKISKINSKISSTWNNYLEDLKAIDGRLAGNRGSVNDSIVASKLSKLPTLKEYSANLYTKINSASAVVGTAEKLGWSENKDFADNLSDSIEIIGSSAVVVATSVKSGMAGLEEDIVDGALWLGTAAVTGTATLFGEEEWANNAQDTMMDVISYDVVGEANKALYEKTSLGRKINEKSILKYDSEVAQNIQSVSTKATEVAAATALTVATGGVAAPVAALIVGGTGFLVGAGDKAQEDFSKDNRNFWENSKEIAISGGIKAVEFYSEGQMGAGAINAVGAIKSAGGVKNLFSSIKTVLANGEGSLFTKDAFKNGIKATFKDPDTYMDSLGAAFDNITYDNENGIQIDWKGLAKETACNFAMNSVFGFVGNAFETRMTSGIKNLELESTSGIKIEKGFPEGYDFSQPKKSVNQTNFEYSVDRKVYDLTDKYNYLRSLNTHELINKGQNFDANTGVKLTEVDELLKQYKKQIAELQDLVFKDDIVMTPRQRILYDTMNDYIEKLNKQFGSEYGADIGIRKVTAYANEYANKKVLKEVGLIKYIPEDYRKIIKDYSYNELQEYLFLRNQIKICNDFSKNGKMTNNYTNIFSKYVDANRIAQTKDVNIFLTDKAFSLIDPFENSTAMAFNDGFNSYMNFSPIYSPDIVKANISHENIHQMSYNNGIHGICFDESHIGINETFTEYLNMISLKTDYPKESYCAYQPMVNRLNLLVQKGVFTNDDIMKAYFNNDISSIKNKVNQLAGSSNYYDEFVAAFQNAHDNYQYDDLDRCCSHLDIWNSRKNRRRDFGDTLDLSEITQEIQTQ